MLWKVGVAVYVDLNLMQKYSFMKTMFYEGERVLDDFYKSNKFDFVQIVLHTLSNFSVSANFSNYATFYIWWLSVMCLYNMWWSFCQIWYLMSVCNMFAGRAT